MIQVDAADLVRRAVDMHLIDVLEEGPVKVEPFSYTQGILNGSMALVEQLKEQGHQVNVVGKIDLNHIRTEVGRLQ